MKINYEAVTIEDCIAMMDLKQQASVIENGHVSGFTYEDPCGDICIDRYKKPSERQL